MIRKILIACTLLLICGQALAQGTQTFTKTLLTPQNIQRGDPVNYRFDFSCSSLTADCGMLSITDTLPPDLELVTCPVALGFTIMCAGNTVDIVKDTTFLDGDIFALSLNARARVEATQGVPIVNMATSTITLGPGGNPDMTTDSADPVTVEDPNANYIVRKTRTSPADPLMPAADTDIEYRVSLCAVSGIDNTDLNSAMLVDTYTPGATVVFTDGGIDNGTTITWDLGDIDLTALYAGQNTSSEQCVSRTVVLFFPSGAFPLTTPIPNTVMGSGIPAEGPGTGFPPGNETATVPDVISPPTPGVNISKSADDVLGGPGGGPLDWGLSANINGSNVPVTDLTIYESIPQLPAGSFPLDFTSGQWNSPSNSQGTSQVVATISTSTTAIAGSNSTDCALVAAYDPPLATAIVSPGSPITFPLVGNETCIRWQFSDISALPSAPAVPRGWQFTTSPRFRLDTAAVAGPYPISVENCLVGSFDDSGIQTDGPSCSSANIEDPTPAINASKNRLSPAGNVQPGQDVQYRLTFTHVNSSSTGPTFDPIITDLLPPEMEFVSWDAYNFGGGAQPPPNLEVIPNFAGSRTLLRFSWATPALPGSLQIDGSPGMDNSASFDESIADGDMPQMEITVRVLDGTPPGSFTNEVAFFDFSPIAPTCNSTGNEGGLFDLNDNGMNMDDYCSGTDGVTVIQAAVLGGQKFVRGDMDPTRPNVDDPTIDPMVVDSFCEGAPNGFTRFPCVAQTDHDGQFEYEIRLVNSGNVPLTDYILYDVLPDVGDTGVGPALQGSMRDSTWRPVINGPVAFLNGFLIDGITPFNPAFTVEYTTAANPCRNELSDTPPFPAGCSNTYQPFGAIADPTTITGFRIQIAYPGPQFWPAGATVNFMVPMDAPPDAPPSIPGNASFFNPAWNSFGHRATDQIPGIRLPAAEPRKVGIILPPAYRLGNLVWFDANRNGLAESGEPGIANVMVEARIDDDGTAGPSAGDTVVDSQMTDVNGKYLFSNLDAGTYYVLIPAGQDGAGLPLEDLLQTDVGEEATPDSDGDNNDNGVIVVAGLGLASGNVTLGPLDVEPTNEVDRVGGPDDDNDLYPDELSNVTVDFGYWRPFSLGNRVWLDDGAGTPMGSGFNNGLREATEMGIDGITVNLLDGSGAAFDTDPLTPGTQNSTVTANGGYYLFDNLPAGNFRVELDLTGGFENLESSTGANGNVNMFEPGADPENGTDDDDNGTRIDTMTIRSAVVTLATVDMPNEPVMEADLDASLANPQGTDTDGNPIPDIQGNMTVDFGLFETYSLGNRVWFDENNSGTIDGEAGIDGVTVRIFEDFNTDTVPDGPEIATDTTAGGGYYRFDNLRTGDYIVEVVIPAGTRSSDPDAGDPDADVDEDDDNGVVVDLIAGTVRANPVTLGPMGSEPVADNEDGPGDPGTVDDHSNLTVDFGFVPIYSLGNRVWLDDDNSGDINGEAGIDGITVNLYLDNNDDGTPDGGVIDTTVTANGGYYRFDNLLADTYIVESAIPLNLYSSTPDAGDPDMDADDSDDNGVIVLPGFVRSNPVTLGPGTVEPTLEPDLGPGDQGSIDARANMTVDFGFTPPVSIGSTVFLDPENNGVQDGGGTNPGIANVTVELWSTGADGMIGGGDDSMAGMQLTSGAGDYFFDNLVPGNYYVQLPASNFGAGQPLEFIRLSSVPTSAADDQTDGDDNGTQAGGIGTLIQSAVINLNVGQEVDDTVETFQGGTQDNAAIASEDSGDMTIDFGLIPVVDVVAIGSTVFEDPNNSGNQDGGADRSPTSVTRPISPSAVTTARPRRTPCAVPDAIRKLRTNPRPASAIIRAAIGRPSFIRGAPKSERNERFSDSI